MVGFINGSYQLRHKYDLRAWLGLQTHDKDYGIVKKLALNYEKNFLLSASADGTLFVYKLDEEGFTKSSKGEVINDFLFKDGANGVGEGSFSDEINLVDMEEEDIFDDSLYSI